MKILIAGGGRKIEYLVKSFLEKGHELVVVARDLDQCKALARSFDITVIHGDASVPAILDEAGAGTCDLVAALTPRDPDNLVICQLARKVYGVPHVFATVSNPHNVEVFRKLGVDNVVSATYILAKIIGRMALRSGEDEEHL
ncbi:potassium channel family protein [Anaerotalea alkaliphila]|uniref:TrkA family potassium uptake protein n=1 Tax=Anaerotalea alkaliphila TaxID=2662126 RepID=A0A7X5HWD1_9FIRM|nr:TrkA family potassium uptake protein [Anaerotalea alkaliphila]NDL67821.1 TrkA family potassium uptake protein [Anaerotalea alkaliphila]